MGKGGKRPNPPTAPNDIMETKMEPTIKRVTVQNFLGIEELDVKPSKVTILTGKNGAGKSSFLKAIEAAFHAKGQQVKLIHDDEDSARILVDLGDMQVARGITQAGGNNLTVRSSHGKYDKPQSVLDALTGTPLTFNPVEFFNAKPDEQRGMILSAVPIDVSQADLMGWFDRVLPVDTNQHGLDVLAAAEKCLYDERKEANGVQKERENTVEVLQTEIPEGFDSAAWRGVDVSDVHAEIQAAAEAQAKKAVWEKEKTRLAHAHETLEASIIELKRQLDEKEKDMTVLAEECNDADMQFAAIEIPDASDANAKLQEYTDAKANLDKLDRLAAADAQLVEASEEAIKLDELVKLIRAKPAELMAAANLPIEGLEITPDDIKLNGVSITTLSDSERLLFALDVVKALNSQFKVICVDGVEKLDEENLEIFFSAIADDDYQYFVAQVGEGDELQVETLDERNQRVATANGQQTMFEDGE